MLLGRATAGLCIGLEDGLYEVLEHPHYYHMLKDAIERSCQNLDVWNICKHYLVDIPMTISSQVCLILTCKMFHSLCQQYLNFL